MPTQPATSGNAKPPYGTDLVRFFDSTWLPSGGWVRSLRGITRAGGAAPVPVSSPLIDRYRASTWHEIITENQCGGTPLACPSIRTVARCPKMIIGTGGKSPIHTRGRFVMTARQLGNWKPNRREVLATGMAAGGAALVPQMLRMGPAFAQGADTLVVAAPETPAEPGLRV